MEKTKIVLLYDDAFRKGEIIRSIKNNNIEILSKNKGIINLKDKVIIQKKINPNKALQLRKYEDALILFTSFSGRDIINELKERCSSNLKITEVTNLGDRNIIQYLRQGANNLQIRYIVEINKKYYFGYNCVRPIYTMVTDKEKDLNIISDNNIRNGKKLYLNINDAIIEYKEMLIKIIDKYTKDKENLENTLLSKKLKQIEKKEIKEGINNLCFYIETFKKLLKTPEIKTLIE